MSWIQDLYQTYEACAGAVGVSLDGQDKMLLPIGHTLLKTSVEIHIRSDGTFVDASRDRGQGISICAPCTDDSEGRTANVSPHPLFDQVKYVAGDYNAFTGFPNRRHYTMYIENLKAWCASKYSHPKVTAVYSYVKKGTVLRDLIDVGVFTPEELRNTKQEGDKAKLTIDKVGIRFAVAIEGDLENRVWMDKTVQEKHIQYVSSMEGKHGMCYASGKMLALTENHPKKINSRAASAKLISSNAKENDNNNFVYRGRFHNAHQVVAVSYEASQKAHQALRWLISTRGYGCDTQAIVAWGVDKASQVPSFHEDSYGIYESEIESDADKLIEAGNQTFIDYARLLNAALLSSGNVNRLRAHARDIAVMATDATTDRTGRMSITYYRRLGENEYLERVVNWHSTCKWYQPFSKDKDGKYKPGYFIGAPSFDRIIDAVLGRKRSQTDANYDKQKKAARERLLHCVFDGERIPRDMVNAAIHRASNPLALEKTDAKGAAERWRGWEQVLCAACAMVKRYYHDYKEEEFEVVLEDQRTDRDYLYGRLLAVADRIESAARYKQGTAKDDARATNAIRYMNAFSQRPFRTWNMLFTQQLNPYIQQLNGAGWYLNQIESIKALFNVGEYESDSPLDGKYLLGFFAQRQALRQRQGENNKGTNGGEIK
ncbi:MAG: CRISPR-associated protein [Bacillota bacterium]|nr:MAG: CRISPR-associated protein [Bacillota bacterium]